LEFGGDLTGILIRPINQLIQTFGTSKGIETIFSLHINQDFIHMLHTWLLKVNGRIDPIIMRIRYKVEWQHKGKDIHDNRHKPSLTKYWRTMIFTENIT
jgi:hypothetical protein